MMSWY